VPEFCTCGARLPEDARFCHKCGKPQREEPLLAAESELSSTPEPLPATAPAEAPETARINLRNGFAVRAALLAGVAAFFLSAPLGALGLVVMIAGGIFAVYLYRRSTGQRLTVANGAKLGWITGLFLFVLLLITFTLSAALEPGFFDQLQAEAARRSALPAAEVERVVALLRTPAGIFVLILGMFLSSTLPPAAGGAIGAKLLGRS
jgi:hypothetical protein